ncbi:MAG: hypothetical protein LJE91_04220 [Gammaproteobacteria bacterium]|jgi:hypothetical protein|nr:hypothetical protein [Gammaproteobacteria bacterium]
MALAAGALLMTTANAQDSAEPAASDASGTKPPMDELTSLKQNPVSGLRRVSFDAVVAPDAPPSGQTEGVYSLQVVWPFALPTPDYKLLTYSILPVLQRPESSSGDTTVGLGNILINVFVAPTKSDRFLVYAGGGLNSLGGIAIDGEGNLWADDNFLVGSQSTIYSGFGGGLSKLAPNGKPLSPMTTGFRGGGIDGPGFGIAVSADDKAIAGK